MSSYPQNLKPIIVSVLTLTSPPVFSVSPFPHPHLSKCLYLCAFSPEWWWRSLPTAGTLRNQCTFSSTSPQEKEGGALSRVSPSFLVSGATTTTLSNWSAGRLTTSPAMHLAFVPPPTRCPAEVQLVMMPATQFYPPVRFPSWFRGSVTLPHLGATRSQLPPQFPTLLEHPLCPPGRPWRLVTSPIRTLFSVSNRKPRN